MPLDPTLKAFLDQFASVPGPKMWEMSAAEARATFVGLFQLVGPKDVPIGKVEDRAAPGGGGEIPLRIYTPAKAAAGHLPALVYYHGGGFVIGDLDTHDGLCRMIANESGCKVVAVHYRLAPEHKFPSAAEDAYDALLWVQGNAPDLGIDPKRIAVGGDSAGGNLAAVVAQEARDRAGPKLALQLLLFPVTQIGDETHSLKDFAEGYFLERKGLDWFYANYLAPGTDRSDPRHSPLKAKSFAGLPPAHVVLGGYDPLHDEGLDYANRMRAAGVPVTIAEYPDMVHCFFYLQGVLPQAKEAIGAMAQALRRAFAEG